MFGWLSAVFGWATSNIGGPIVGFILDLISGVYGFLHGIFSRIGQAWNDVWQAAHNIWNEIVRFLHAVWTKLLVIIRVIIPVLARWAVREVTKLFKFANFIIAWAWNHIQRLYAFIEQVWDDITAWVIRNIWTPLLHDFLNVWHWITHFGAIAWFYISHPDKLVELIWVNLIAKLEKEAWAVSALLGKFFLSLIVRHLRQFVLLLEDIISAVL